MSPERKNPLQNLGVAKQSAETREDYLACILKLSQKKGIYTCAVVRPDDSGFRIGAGIPSFYPCG